MTRLLLIFLYVITSLPSLISQPINDSIYNSWWANKENSIFESVDNGKFSGTTFGYIHLVNNRDTLVLDFQTTKTSLTINHILDPVYDNNTKTYSTQTTSGRTIFEYETFMLANIMTIVLNGERYSIGVFDGASDMPLPGLTFNYCNERNIEYLTLFVTAPLELSTIRQIKKIDNIDWEEAERKAQTITVLAGTTLILTITK